MQSRRLSALEAVANVCVGLGIGYALNLWLLGLSATQAGGVSLLYTALSLARSYTLRRLFTRWVRS